MDCHRIHCHRSYGYITLRQNDSQRKELLRQNFESTLFFLIKEFREARNQICYNDKLFGIEALSRSWRAFRSHISTYSVEYTDIEKQIPIDCIFTSYQHTINNFLSNLSGYYHSLITALDFIDRSDYNEDTKRMYVAFVENNLTEKDLLWLFYTCVCDGRKQELLRLVEKWQLLRNLPPEKLIQPTHKTWLAPSAFGDK